MHVKGNNKFDNLTWLTRTCRAFVVLPPFHMCSPTNLGFALLCATNDDQIFFFLSLCSHMVFNSLSLSMPMLNVI